MRPSNPSTPGGQKPQMSDIVHIATRQSPLALWQAEHVKGLLEAAHPGLEVRLLRLVTQGDRILDAPLAKVGGKGLFVKELEQALLDGRADLAVHSMKDVPVELPDGLQMPVVLAREEPRDAFVSVDWEDLDALPEGARLGTSSLRRQAQLAARRPDLRIESLRGNVGTRLRRLDEGGYDAIILAAAGLKRLGLEARIRRLLPTEVCLPAIGQGAIGIETRVGDRRVEGLVACLDDPDTHDRIRAERALNARLEGGCQVPIAGHADWLADGRLRLRGLVGRPDGRTIVAAERQGPRGEAESIGRGLAEELLAAGAEEILRELYDGGRS